MIKLLVTVCMLGALAVSPRDVLAQAADNKDKAQIQRVIENFRAAIVNKDQEAFLKLFLKEDITWIGVTTDASIESLYANRPSPEMERPLKIFDSNPREFIGFIARNKAKIDEIISNVRIDSDGDVGQVWFDYSLVNGGFKQNWGKESWQMVRTADGWKIAGVVWSQEMNPSPPPLAEAPMAALDDPEASAANFRGYLSWEGCRRPVYPRASVRNEESGTVRLAFLVGADGKLKDSKIVRSSGFRDLDNAAHSALKECPFHAAIENGKPVESWVELEYRWAINSKR